MRDVFEGTSRGDVQAASVQTAAFDASPLRRAISAYFTCYGNLLQPRTGPQKGDL